MVKNLPSKFDTKLLREKIKRICEANDITFLALFGSFATGKATKTSDVDLIVKFDKKKEKSLLDLIHAENEMKKVFKRKVDLLTVSGLSPYLRENILSSMRVVYER